MEIDLRDVRYAEGACFNRAKTCLVDTRKRILDDITEWINSTDDVPRVLLLSGPAGTGKSSIAHTIAFRFDNLGRLGSSFCFARSRQAELRPDTLFPTLACDLASHDP